MPSLTAEAAHQLASAIAAEYGSFECDRCAKAIAKRLGWRFNAQFERLRTADNSDVIGHLKRGIQVSANRVHVGIRIGERVFDNVNHEGVLADEWSKAFVTATDAPLIRESRPISEFFAKVFLVKKFERWLFGP